MMHVPACDSNNPDGPFDVNVNPYDSTERLQLLADFLLGTCMMLARAMMDDGEFELASQIADNVVAAYADISLIKSDSGENREAMKLGLTDVEYQLIKQQMAN